MFPLSDMFMVLVPFWGFLAIAAVFFALALRSASWGPRAAFLIIPVLTGAALLAWRVSETDMNREYAGLGILLLFVFGLAGLVGTAFWVFLVVQRLLRNWPSGWAPVFVSLLPVLGMVAYVAETQRLGDWTCAVDYLPVQVADQRFHVFPELEAQIDLIAPADGHRGPTYRYLGGTRDKADVRRLCDLSRRGAKPVTVEVIRLPARGLQENRQAMCGAGSVRASAQRYCDMVPPGQTEWIAQVVIEARTGASLQYEMIWFDKAVPGLGSRVERTFVSSGSRGWTRGDTNNGSVCLEDEDSGADKICYVWRSPVDGILARAVTQRVGAGVPHADLRGAAEAALSFGWDALHQ